MNKPSAHREKMERLYGQNARIVASNKCPDCGSVLRRNWSMSGWWQCEQFGSERFRARPQEPACSWQVFTS